MIIGINSIELSISENISFSSQLAQFTERWRYQRLNGEPDMRYKDNYRITQPANCEYHADISYTYRLVVDGIYFTATSSDEALVNKIVSKWNNASF